MLWVMRSRVALVADRPALHDVSLKPALGLPLRLAFVADDHALKVVSLKHALGQALAVGYRSR